MWKKIVLKDALRNLSASENGDEHEYGRGLLVGVVAGMMACGLTWERAIELCRELTPDDIHPERVPESWRSAMGL